MDTLYALLATTVFGTIFIGFTFLCSAFVSLVLPDRKAY